MPLISHHGNSRIWSGAKYYIDLSYKVIQIYRDHQNTKLEDLQLLNTSRLNIVRDIRSFHLLSPDIKGDFSEMVPELESKLKVITTPD